MLKTWSPKKHDDKNVTNAGETANQGPEEVQGETVPDDQAIPNGAAVAWRANRGDVKYSKRHSEPQMWPKGGKRNWLRQLLYAVWLVLIVSGLVLRTVASKVEAGGRQK